MLDEEKYYNPACLDEMLTEHQIHITITSRHRKILDAIKKKYNIRSDSKVIRAIIESSFNSNAKDIT